MVLGYRNKKSGQSRNCFNFQGQIKKFDELSHWFKEYVSWFSPTKLVMINTPKGNITVEVGDWIVETDAGITVFKDDVFKIIYEEIPKQIYDDHADSCPTCGHYRYYDEYYW